VIVASDRREIWLEAVSAQRLAFTGEETVYVGGPAGAKRSTSNAPAGSRSATTLSTRSGCGKTGRTDSSHTNPMPPGPKRRSPAET